VGGLQCVHPLATYLVYHACKTAVNGIFEVGGFNIYFVLDYVSSRVSVTELAMLIFLFYGTLVTVPYKCSLVDAIHYSVS